MCSICSRYARVTFFTYLTALNRHSEVLQFRHLTENKHSGGTRNLYYKIRYSKIHFYKEDVSKSKYNIYCFHISTLSYISPSFSQ